MWLGAGGAVALPRRHTAIASQRQGADALALPGPSLASHGVANHVNRSKCQGWLQLKLLFCQNFHSVKLRAVTWRISSGQCDDAWSTRQSDTRQAGTAATARLAGCRGTPRDRASGMPVVSRAACCDASRCRRCVTGAANQTSAGRHRIQIGPDQCDWRRAAPRARCGPGPSCARCGATAEPAQTCYQAWHTTGRPRCRTKRRRYRRHPPAPAGCP